MALFSSHSSVIYIKKNSLVFYISSSEKQLELPSDIASDIDIKDPLKYQKLIEDFTTGSHIKKTKVLIVLSPEVTFQKIIPVSEIKNLAALSQAFTEIIPSDTLVTKNIPMADGIHLLATNKKIYQLLIDKLKELSWDIEGIFPIILVTEDNELNQEAIRKIPKDLIKKSDFLDGRQPELDPQNYMQSPKKAGILKILTILLIIILLAVVFGALWYFRANFAPQKTSSKSPPTDSPISTESAQLQTATDSAQVKDLTVQVLNGTGVAGQAGLVKDQLQELELSDIEVGNAEGAGTGDTVVIFSDSVPQTLKDKIVNLLKDDFANVEVQKAPDSLFDVLITTGKQKS